jgi:hypothetical protein
MAQQRAEQGTTVIDSIDCRLMRQLRSASASPTLRGRCKPDLPALNTAVVLTWRKISLTAKLMADPRNGARAVIRGTRSDAGRYLWSVLAAGETDPMPDGRTDDLARAQSIAEAALRAYAEDP